MVCGEKEVIGSMKTEVIGSYKGVNGSYRTYVTLVEQVVVMSDNFHPPQAD